MTPQHRAPDRPGGSDDPGRGRRLGVDVGSVRIGVASSDPDALLATPVETVRRHVWVSGRVQGVWFRQTCADRARSLGVAGWVRNLPDDRVEAVFEGPPAVVQAMGNAVIADPFAA